MQVIDKINAMWRKTEISNPKCASCETCFGDVETEFEDDTAKIRAETRFIGTVYSDDIGFVRILPVLNHHHVLARHAHGGTFSDSDVVVTDYLSAAAASYNEKGRNEATIRLEEAILEEERDEFGYCPIRFHRQHATSNSETVQFSRGKIFRAVSLLEFLQ